MKCGRQFSIRKIKARWHLRDLSQFRVNASKPACGNSPQVLRCRFTTVQSSEAMKWIRVFQTKFRVGTPLTASGWEWKALNGTHGSRLSGRVKIAATKGKPIRSATLPPAHSAWSPIKASIRSARSACGASRNTIAEFWQKRWKMKFSAFMP